MFPGAVSTERKKISKRVIFIIALLLFVIAGGILLFRNYVSIRGQHLESYTYSSGGGMTGGYRTKTVKKYSDKALITIESAEWHSQDPDIAEYLVDASVLKELEEVVRKHHMNFWNEKKFTNMFVSDGESEGHYFEFDRAYLSFSSQIYPPRYQNKLNELGDVVEKYIEAGKKLPGLVKSRTDLDEMNDFPENELEIYVYSYAENSLGIKVLNGTDGDVELNDTFKLINTDTGAVLLEDKTPFISPDGVVNGQSQDEMEIRMKERLAVGDYKLIFGQVEVPFKIR